MVDSSNGANGFFDPFTSMSSFVFFNPKDSSSGTSIPPILSAATSANFGGLSDRPHHQTQQQTMMGSSGLGHHGGHGQKSPTTPSYHTQNSHSPLFGGSLSPTGFFGTTGTSNTMNHNGSVNNQFNSNNYSSNNKFPITTFSIEDTLQQVSHLFSRIFS